MDREAFDEIVAACDTAMVVVTASAGGERSGCLVGFHSQCSIEPLRYALWLSKANHTYGVALEATHLGIHFLSSDDGDLAELFGTLTGDEVDKFARCEHEEGVGGVPLLSGCANRMVVRRVALADDGGDHVCFVTEPVTVGRAGASGRASGPLRFGAVADLTAGHEADD